MNRLGFLISITLTKSPVTNILTKLWHKYQKENTAKAEQEEKETLTIQPKQKTLSSVQTAVVKSFLTEFVLSAEKSKSFGLLTAINCFSYKIAKVTVKGLRY